MDVPLPWERLLCTGRSLWPLDARYAITDFRLVQIGRRGVDEILLQDVHEIRCTQSPIDRLIGVSTLAVSAHDTRRPPILLRRIRRGSQLAALLELVAGEWCASLDADGVRAALAWEPPTERRRGVGTALIMLAATFASLFAAGIGIHGKAATITYPPDDAIAPNGTKRDRAAITRFMEASVMPWARQALGPIKGGPDRVTCETCHGRDAQARDWHMPAVAALPNPDVAFREWGTLSAGMDSQTRNAIYGYSAESDKQSKAAYMRKVVLPGMARSPASPRLRFHEAVRLQPHAAGIRLLSLPSGHSDRSHRETHGHQGRAPRGIRPRNRGDEETARAAARRQACVEAAREVDVARRSRDAPVDDSDMERRYPRPAVVRPRRGARASASAHISRRRS